MTGNAQKVSDGVDALDKTMSDQHIKDVEDMLPLTEKFDSLKSKLSMLIKDFELLLMQSKLIPKKVCYGSLDLSLFSCLLSWMSHYKT